MDFCLLPSVSFRNLSGCKARTRFSEFKMVDWAFGSMVLLRVANCVIDTCLLWARFGVFRTFFSVEVRASYINPWVSSSSTAYIGSKRIRLCHIVSTHYSGTVRIIVIIVVVGVEVALCLDMVGHKLTVGDLTSFWSSSPDTLKEIFSTCRFTRNVLNANIGERPFIPISFNLLDVREVNSAHLVCLAQSNSHPNR